MAHAMTFVAMQDTVSSPSPGIDAGLGIGRVRLPVNWTCPSPLCPGAVVVAGIAAVRLACDTRPHGRAGRDGKGIL
jgi:hypothetical protein